MNPSGSGLNVSWAWAGRRITLRKATIGNTFMAISFRVVRRRRGNRRTMPARAADAVDYPEIDRHYAFSALYLTRLL
jgi:hypothetical protein